MTPRTRALSSIVIAPTGEVGRHARTSNGGVARQASGILFRRRPRDFVAERRTRSGPDARSEAAREDRPRHAGARGARPGPRPDPGGPARVGAALPRRQRPGG